MPSRAVWRAFARSLKRRRVRERCHDAALADATAGSTGLRGDCRGDLFSNFAQAGAARRAIATAERRAGKAGMAPDADADDAGKSRTATREDDPILGFEHPGRGAGADDDRVATFR